MPRYEPPPLNTLYECDFMATTVRYGGRNIQISELVYELPTWGDDEHGIRQQAHKDSMIWNTSYKHRPSLSHWRVPTVEECARVLRGQINRCWKPET